MSEAILIMGNSGTGKSTAVRTLDSKTTCLINVLDKPLPFKGWKKKYSADKKNSNYFCSDEAAKITAALDKISQNRPDIKCIIIDDFQYIMGNEYMRRAHEKGYEKFTSIGKSAWDVVVKSMALRPDLYVVLLGHTDTNEEGFTKLKTIGKMCDEKINLEGMFTVILASVMDNDKYIFITNRTGAITAKTPMGMFADLKIPNDLKYVIDKIEEYNETTEEEDIKQNPDQRGTTEDVVEYANIRGGEEVSTADYAVGS